MAKTRNLMEVLRAAQDDVSKTTDSVVTAIREQPEEAVPLDYGEQLGASIEKYADNVGNFLRAIGDQAAALGESYRAESSAVADSIKQIGQLEAERCKGYIHRMRELATTMAMAKKEFEKAVGHQINGGSGPIPAIDMEKLGSLMGEREQPDGEQGKRPL